MSNFNEEMIDDLSIITEKYTIPQLINFTMALIEHLASIFQKPVVLGLVKGTLSNIADD